MASLWLRQLALHLHSQVKASFLFGCLCLFVTLQRVKSGYKQKDFYTNCTFLWHKNVHIIKQISKKLKFWLCGAELSTNHL